MSASGIWNVARDRARSERAAPTVRSADSDNADRDGRYGDRTSWNSPRPGRPSARADQWPRPTDDDNDETMIIVGPEPSASSFRPSARAARPPAVRAQATRTTRQPVPARRATLSRALAPASVPALAQPPPAGA